MRGHSRLRSNEFDNERQNNGADDQERAKLDDQLLFHFLNVSFQFGFGCLKAMLQFGPEFLNIVL